MNKLILHWASQIYQNSVGNGYGYRVHCENLFREVNKIADIDDKAEDVLLICSPEFIREFPGKRFWLFTMFEGQTIPDRYLEKMKLADYWITPSWWVKKLFEGYFPKEKIFVCNHGVSPDFTYVKRRFPFWRAGEKFRFLWVGAPNPRKGYEPLIITWRECGFLNDSRLELYVKTTMQDGSDGGIQKNRNVFLDRRNISKEELIKLYHKAHCFLAPHMGEGFHLGLAEAMRTGLPCIATNYSGVKDFFSKDVGYPVGYTFSKGHVKFIGDGYEAETRLALPNIAELANQMINIIKNYDKALSKGRRASDLISNKFTWQKSAQTLVNIIQSVKNEEISACIA